MSFISFDGAVGHNVKKISFRPSVISLNSSDSKIVDRNDKNLDENKSNFKRRSQILDESSKKENFQKKSVYKYKICGTVKNYSDDINFSVANFKKITIELYTAKNLNVPISSINLNETGEFKFQNLNENLYIIRVIPIQGFNLVPKGDLSDISNKTFLSDELDVSNSDVELKIGLRKSFEISGIAYFDKFDVGIYRYNNINRNEGINEVLVELFDASDNLVSSVFTITSSLTKGYFSFNNIVSGKYRLVFTPDDDLICSKQLKNNKFSSMADKETSSLEIVINNESINDIFVGFTKIKG
ncbi:MAG: SdrD B-like domain-containing protein [Sarcina sp.]